MADEVPDIYCDSTFMVVTPFDVIIQLQKRTAAGMTDAMAPPNAVGYVRMSLGQAKTLAIGMKKSLKKLEEALGQEIPLHPDVNESMGINLSEDW